MQSQDLRLCTSVASPLWGHPLVGLRRANDRVLRRIGCSGRRRPCARTARGADRRCRRHTPSAEGAGAPGAAGGSTWSRRRRRPTDGRAVADARRRSCPPRAPGEGGGTTETTQHGRRRTAAGTRRARLPARHRRRGRRRVPVPRTGRASAKPCRGRRPHSGVGHTPRRTRTVAGAAPGRCPDVCLPGGRGRSAGRRAFGRDRGSNRCRPGLRPPPGGGVRARRARGHRCVAGEVVGSTGSVAVSLRSAVGGLAGVRARPLPIVRGARRGAWACAPRPRGSRPGAARRARLVGAAHGGAD